MIKKFQSMTCCYGYSFATIIVGVRIHLRAKVGTKCVSPITNSKNRAYIFQKSLHEKGKKHE
jgi:hypothetical protein